MEISTVNGDVTFNGTMRDGGAYRLTTHGGDLRVGLGGAPNATVFVRTFQGDFTADFPIQLPEGQSAREGSKRFNFTLGSGSARIELQSFNGDIVVARKTILSPDEIRRQRRESTPKAPVPPRPKGELAGNWHWDAEAFAQEFEMNFEWEASHFEHPHVPYVDAPTPPAPPVPPAPWPVPLPELAPAPFPAPPPVPPVPGRAPRPPQ
jgi:hypothetical protein